MVGRDHHDVNEISKCICGYFHGLYGFTEKLLQPSVFCQYEFKLASELLMFGSNNPRFRHVRSLDGILNLPLREDVKKAILGENAIRFLGLED